MARQHASAEDFELVGLDRDPTPGDPELIRGVIKRYQDVGDAAEKALNVLKKDGSVSRGRGSAMDQLRQKIGDDLPDKLSKTANSYHDAARAYSDYIPRLQEAQDTFDRAVDQARSAAAKAGRTPRTLGENPTDQERAQARAVQDEIDAGNSEMSAAKSLAQQARQMRESAQRTCADTLDRAASEAIPERNVFQKIADFFKDFPFVQILLAALIAVVAVFFPVVGALLGGALFVFNQVVASQTGGVKAGDFIAGLIGIVPGAALFRLGSKAVQAIAPAAVAAIKNSAAVTKVTGTITRVGDSIAANKAVGAVLANPVGRTTVDVTGKFLTNSALEAGAKAANHDKITAAGVFAGAAAGAVAGAAFKGGIGRIGSARGNPPVPSGGGGRFGDTTDPALGDTIDKRASDQVGGFIEEGATLGTKIGVGVAQGGDPNEVAAGEIANSAPKLGAGPVGVAGLGRKIDGVADGIPVKGSTGPGTTTPAPSGTGAAPTPAPADVPPPSSPTAPTGPTSPTTSTAPAAPASPTSPTGPTPPTTSTAPAAPASPTSPTGPTPPTTPTAPASPTGPGGAAPAPADVPPPSSPAAGHPSPTPLETPPQNPPGGGGSPADPGSRGSATGPLSSPSAGGEQAPSRGGSSSAPTSPGGDDGTAGADGR
ncbi:putative T7SS-secreted protein [Streptomyces sp. NPDC001070]